MTILGIQIAVTGAIVVVLASWVIRWLDTQYSDWAEKAQAVAIITGLAAVAATIFGILLAVWSL